MLQTLNPKKFAISTGCPKNLLESGAHKTPLLDTFRLQLDGAIYRPDSFVLMLRYCGNLKAIRYESTSLNRIAADKSQRVIVA